MKKRTQQLHVASLEKAIDHLLLAHQNVVDSWYADWEQQLRSRAESLMARRFQGPQPQKSSQDFELM